MSARFGIELSPNACRIIAIDPPAPWSRQARDTRVRSFDLLPASASETGDRLASLRRQTAAVVVWTASEHRQVVVTGGSYESMRAEALDALAGAGVQTQGVVADITSIVGPPRKGVRLPVVVSLAPASDLSAQVQPLHEAGIRLRAVTTPAVALASLARTRRAFSVPGAIEAYVALEDTATCIALVRDATLVAARNLPWGYGDERPAGIVTRPRAEIAARLGVEVTDFVAAIGGEMRSVGQVCVCGGLQELRSMTAPLMERLDVEVEPLDSLLGIDIAHLPEPADEFRERSAELRLAWAVATDWPPPINLLRARRRQESKRVLSRVAVAAGVAAGVTAGWRIEQSQWLQSIVQKPFIRTASNSDARRPSPARAPLSRVAPPPDVGPRLPPPPPDVGPQLPPAVTSVQRPAPTVERAQPPSPLVAANKPPTVVPPPPDVGPKLPAPVTTPAPAAVAPSKPLVVAPPAVSAVERPAPSAASRSVPPARGAAELNRRTQPEARSVERPPATRVEPAVPRPAPRARVEPSPPARAEPPAVSSVERPAESHVDRPAMSGVERPPVTRARPVAPPPPPLPFDAVLGTILYSPDRKLAIIDGRIVAPGDDVRGARVIEITPTAVMLRDSQGRLRRLALAGGR